MKKTENRNPIRTDSGIPAFSWRSALLISATTFFLTALTVWLSKGSRFWIILVLSLSMAATVSCSRFFIDTKRGMGKAFWLSALLVFAACAVIMQFLQF